MTDWFETRKSSGIYFFFPVLYAHSKDYEINRTQNETCFIIDAENFLYNTLIAVFITILIIIKSV